jgi:predicted dehydrogenase
MADDFTSVDQKGKSLKVAVVGLGYWGPQLVRNLHHLDLCTGIVACDKDETRVKAVTRQYPTAVGLGSIDDVLGDPDIRAVVLATPVATHGELARQVLGSGKSVLVEKPFATSVAEATDLIDLARDAGLLVMAAHTFLYSPAVRVVRDLLEKGEIGTVLYAQSSRVNLGLHQSDVSVISDLAPHDLSILGYWLGERASWVSAHGRSSHGVGPADVAFIDVGYPSGCIANLHLSWLAPTKVRRTTLVGSKRMVVYEDTRPEEPIKIYDKGVELPDPEDFGQYRATYRSGDVVSPRVESWEPLRAELEDFLTRVAAGEGPDAREDAARDVVAATEGAERSLAGGGVVIEL